MPRFIAAAAVAVALSVPTKAEARKGKVVPVCANHLCTRLLPHTPSCSRFGTAQRTSRCWIVRSAHHHRVSWRWLMRVAHCESHYLPWAHNASGASGLYQFMPGTFGATPYRGRSLWSARWSALAAGWAFRHGWAGQWSCA